MKKLLLIPIAIIAILVIGKFGLEYRYKQKLDELITQGAIFVDASYDKLFIDLQGGVNIKNLRFSDKTGQFFNGSFGNIRVFSSDRTMLVRGFKAIEDGKFPKLLELKVDSMLLDLSNVQQINDSRECRYIEEPNRIDTSTLATSPSNFTVRTEDVDQDFFKMTFYSITQSVSRTSGEIVVEKSLTKSPLAAASSNSKMPIKNIEISNKFDSAYTDKYISYCAEKLNMSTNDFVNNVIGGDRFYKALGFVPTSKLKDAIKRHFSGESELSLKIKPKSTAKNFNQLALYKPKQIISALNLVVTEDGEAIPDLVKSEAQVKLENLAKQKAEQENTSGTTAAQASQPKPKFYGQRKFSYQAINKSDIRKHIGKDVKIYRKKRLIKGELLGASGGNIKVKSSLHGGSTTMNLSLSEISKIEVKQFKPIN